MVSQRFRIPDLTPISTTVTRNVNDCIVATHSDYGWFTVDWTFTRALDDTLLSASAAVQDA